MRFVNDENNPFELYEDVPGRREKSKLLEKKVKECIKTLTKSKEYKDCKKYGIKDTASRDSLLAYIENLLWR
jgi:hypothetical protein